MSEQTDAPTEAPRRRKIDEQTLSYFKRVATMLEENSFSDDADRELFLTNVFREMKKKQIDLLQDFQGNKVMDAVMRVASSQHVRSFLINLEGLYNHVASHARSSHIMELALHRIPPWAVDFDSKSADPDDEDKSMHEILLALTGELNEHWAHLACHPAGSHVMRTIIDLLGGIERPPAAPGKGKAAAEAAEPTRHKVASDLTSGGLNAIVDSLSEAYPGMGLPNLTVDQYAGPVLQNLMEALAPTRSRCDKLIRRVLMLEGSKEKKAKTDGKESESKASKKRKGGAASGDEAEPKKTKKKNKKKDEADEEMEAVAVAEEAEKEGVEDAGGEEPEARKTFEVTDEIRRKHHQGLMQHRVGSHTIESALKYSSDQLNGRLYRDIFQGTLLERSRHAVANYCVQQLLRSVRDRDVAKAALDELGSGVQELLTTGRAGVVLAMAQACAAQNVWQNRLCKLLAAVAAVDDNGTPRPERFVEYLLHLNSAPDTISKAGAPIAMACMSFPPSGCPLPAASLLALDDASLRALCMDAAGSRVVEAFLRNEEAAPQRDKFAEKLQGQWTGLAMNKYGSHIVETCAATCSHAGKEALTRELVADAHRLKDDFFGKFILRNLKLWREIPKERAGKRKWEAEEDGTMVAADSSRPAKKRKR